MMVVSVDGKSTVANVSLLGSCRKGCNATNQGNIAIVNVAAQLLRQHLHHMPL